MNGWLARSTVITVALGLCNLTLPVGPAWAKPPGFDVAQCDGETGACCTNHFPMLVCSWAGIMQGPGTSCLGEQACCLGEPDNICLDGVDAICCDDLGGYLMGAGTDCGDPVDYCSPRACCLTDPDPEEWYCTDYNVEDCLARGGTPQEPGVACDDEELDGDGDFILDACDNCPFNYNPLHGDGDVDGVGDVCDNCPVDYNPRACNFSGGSCLFDEDCPLDEVCAQPDCNGDGEGDACEPDWDDQDNDFDGVCNSDDNCPDGHNPGQENDDQDSHGNVCDNCPLVDNEDQRDCDGDGAGDDCDVDIDGDGILNDDDACDFTPAGAGIVNDATSPWHGTLVADIDGDCDVDQADYDRFVNSQYPADFTDSGTCAQNDNTDQTEAHCANPNCD